MTDFDNIELSTHECDWASSMVPMINDSCKDAFSKAYGVQQLPELIYAGNKEVKIDVYANGFCPDNVLIHYLKYLVSEYPLLVNSGLSYAIVQDVVFRMCVKVPYKSAGSVWKPDEATLNVIKFVNTITINGNGKMPITFNFDGKYTPQTDLLKFTEVTTCDDVYNLKQLISSICETLRDNDVDLDYISVRNNFINLCYQICAIAKIKVPGSVIAGANCYMRLEIFNKYFDKILTKAKKQNLLFAAAIQECAFQNN